MPAEEVAHPEGVWLEYADGERVEDLPCVYVGQLDGCAVYDVLTPRDEPPVAAGMRKLPSMTTVRIPALIPKEHHAEHPTDPDRDDRGSERGGEGD